MSTALDGKDVDAPVVYVAPGEHVAEANDKGTRVRKVVSVAAGAQVSVTLAPAAQAVPLAGRSGEGPIGPPRPHKPLPPVDLSAAMSQARVPWDAFQDFIGADSFRPTRS